MWQAMLLCSYVAQNCIRSFLMPYILLLKCAMQGTIIRVHVAGQQKKPEINQALEKYITLLSSVDYQLSTD